MHDPISSFKSGAATHVGKLRQHNEDSYLVAAESGVWAVADGMGGHAAGDVASRTVVEELAHIGPPSSAAQLLASCEARMIAANNRLKQLSEDRGSVVIGTTVAMLLIYQKAFACVWSGDSRIYRIRKSQIKQLSTDHTEVQELVDEGKLTPEQARVHPGRNVITRAIGTGDNPELAIVNGTLEPRDVFVICSDGLTGHVEDREILAAAESYSPQRACDVLIDLTLDRGANDNVTVVMVSFDPAATTLVPTVHNGVSG